MLDIIKVIDIGISNRLFDSVDPLVSILRSVQVINSLFIGEDQHEWVKNTLLGLFLLKTFDENSR